MRILYYIKLAHMEKMQCSGGLGLRSVKGYIPKKKKTKKKLQDNRTVSLRLQSPAAANTAYIYVQCPMLFGDERFSFTEWISSVGIWSKGIHIWYI